MQFISTLVAGAAVASAAAIPVGSRDTQQNLDISEFSFSGTPHSVISQYQLNVSKSDGSMDAPVQCSTTTNTSPQVAPFDLTPCQDPSWSFAWTALNTSEGSGYNLKVTRLPQDGAAANETGCLFMPDSDVYYWQNPAGPTGNVYRVNQSSTFTMQWSNMNECVYN